MFFFSIYCGFKSFILKILERVKFIFFKQKKSSKYYFKKPGARKKTFRLTLFRTQLLYNLMSCPGLDGELRFCNFLQILLSIIN